MILQALYRYYEILMNDPNVEIALPGYSSANINFALNLSNQGDLLDILPFTTLVKQGNKTREIPSRRMIVPAEVVRSGTKILPNFLWDNAAYVLGLSEKDIEKPEYSRGRRIAFRDFNVSLLNRADCLAAKAISSFLSNYDPAGVETNENLMRNKQVLLKGGNIIFFVEGRNSLEIPEIKQIWEEYLTGQVESVSMQCLVNGEVEPIARIHPKIKGVRDAQSMGASLVSFNEQAYESYNRNDGQGFNSPVSQRVASGYGVALNYLLSPQNPNRKIYIGDTTVVYWAESPDSRYANVFATLLDLFSNEEEASPGQEGRYAAEEALKQVARKIDRGQALDLARLTEGLDPETRFYVLGIAPNAARLAVRFFFKDAFETFVKRILQHYDDLKIAKEFPTQPDNVSIMAILYECVSPKVKKREEEIKATASLLGGALLRAILTGSEYPQALLNTIITRVRIDNDDKDKGVKKLNYTRAAVIKACLCRKHRNKPKQTIQEALTMSLNEKYSHPAYILGRLFAVLEKAQLEAIKNLKTTIKDTYFTSACATPASVFPTLIKLSHHHTAKADYGYSAENRIQQLLNQLEAGEYAFPKRLTLDEQGVFILGYYHQKEAFYSKKENPSVEKIIIVDKD